MTPSAGLTVVAGRSRLPLLTDRSPVLMVKAPPKHLTPVKVADVPFSAPVSVPPASGRKVLLA